MSESDEALLQRLQDFCARDYGLRLSASRISAMAGFHPFAVLPELLMSLVYQGSQELLNHDAKLLGIQIQSDEAVLKELASKASQSTRRALESALEVKRGKRVLDTVLKADQVKQQVLKEAKSSKNLTVQELKVLQEGVRSSVDTGYGTFHEEQALDLYEKKCGWQVRDRNASIMAWPFAKLEDVRDGHVNRQQQQLTVVPLTKASATIRFVASTSSGGSANRSEKTDEIDLNDHLSVADKPTIAVQSDDTKDGDQIMNNAENPPSESTSTIQPTSGSAQHKAMTNVQQLEKSECAIPPTRPMRPFFTIYGAVDGIRDELWCPPNTSYGEETCALNEEWQLRQIIVECKHRMKQTFSSPPLYDQIQTTAYCLMYNVDQADIVQVVRTPKPPRKVQKKNTKEMLYVQSKIITKSERKETVVASEEVIVHASTENKTASLTNVIGSKTDSCTTGSMKAIEKEEVNGEKCLETVQVENVSADFAASAATQIANSTGQQVDDTTKTEACTTSIEIDIKRVSLDDPLLQHRQNWNNVILPRLRSFVDAVYRIRSNDTKRYQLLTAMSNPTGNLLDAWNILHEECPWLKDCDTAFNRDY